MRKRALKIWGAVIIGAVLLAFVLPPVRNYAGWAWRRVAGGATVEERLNQYGPAARQRWEPHFQKVGLVYPPHELALIGIKDEKVLEVWGRQAEGPFVWIRSFPVLAASGNLGPKLREGDRQVPEGLYELESLHPNSLFHLALRVKYPNDFDRRQAQRDGRTALGGDIMIHGKNSSVGCLAMGDQAADDLFVLVADAGIQNTKLILTPVDFRTSKRVPDGLALPPWADELYSQIRSALEQFRHTQAGSPGR